MAALVLTAAVAGAGTCTVTGIGLYAYVPSAFDDPVPFPGTVQGLVLPIDVDENKGEIVFRRQGLPDVTIDTRLAGPVQLQLAGPDVTGSIDAAGNIWLPDVSLNYVFGGLLDLRSQPSLSTSIQSNRLNDREVQSAGKALDFATGSLTLQGADLIPNAPIVEEPVISGLTLTCRLEPIPNRAKLPASAGLRATSTVRGDVLTVRGTLTGRTSVSAKTEDLLVRLAAADGTAILTLRAIAPEGQGTSRSLAVVAGAGTAAPTGKVRAARRKASFTLQASGLPAEAFSNQVVTTVTMGPLVASKTKPVKTTRTGLRF